MAVRELLIETLAHIPPAGALDGLTAADAERTRTWRVPLHRRNRCARDFLGDVVLRPVRGPHAPMVASAAIGWPAVAPGRGPTSTRQFLSTLERAAAFGEDPRHARVTDRPAHRVPAARELHDPRRARARRPAQRAPPGTGHRLAAGDGLVAAAVRQLDVVMMPRLSALSLGLATAFGVAASLRAAAVQRRRPRLHQGRCARRGADQRARDRRHRRAGARESDHHHPRRHHRGDGRSRASTRRPPARTTIDLTGKSVIPGLVMVHEHLYYPTGPGVYGQLGESFIAPLSRRRRDDDEDRRQRERLHGPQHEAARSRPARSRARRSTRPRRT